MIWRVFSQGWFKLESKMHKGANPEQKDTQASKFLNLHTDTSRSERGNKLAAHNGDHCMWASCVLIRFPAFASTPLTFCCFIIDGHGQIECVKLLYSRYSVREFLGKVQTSRQTRCALVIKARSRPNKSTRETDKLTQRAHLNIWGLSVLRIAWPKGS